MEQEKQAVILETDAKDVVSKHIHESFKLSEEDEKLFQKLLKMRSSISGSFSLKFKIETMKNIIKQSELVNFSSPHDEFIDKTLPVFRFSIKISDKYLKNCELSDAAKECITKKIKSSEEIDSYILDELTHFKTQIISKEIFDKYIDKLISAFEEHFQDDDKLKEEYGELYDEIFQIIPERQVKEFICSGIFHLRFYEDNIFNGQFEFIF